MEEICPLRDLGGLSPRDGCRGELVPLVSVERFHIVSPWLAERPVGDAELRFVALMCACWGRALQDGVSGGLTSALVEESTRRAVLQAQALASVVALGDEQAAEALNVSRG